jgi:hypothetical protein
MKLATEFSGDYAAEKREVIERFEELICAPITLEEFKAVVKRRLYDEQNKYDTFSGGGEGEDVWEVKNEVALDFIEQYIEKEKP